MKARTKLQKKVVALDKQLPDVSTEQLDYGYKHCIPHIATVTKNGKHNCMECGYTWISKDKPSKKVVCPSCNSVLEVKETRQRSFYFRSYYSVITTFNGFQVIRMFILHQRCKASAKPRKTTEEVFCNWISPKGEVTTIGLFMANRWYDAWGGNWELRSNNSATDYTFGSAVVYPKFSVIKELKRNGFKKGLHKINPYDFFTCLLKDSKVETILKAKQYNLLAYYLYHKNRGKDMWNTIKIAIRHNYNIPDASIWYDYLDLLEYFNQDLKNPKNVCPEDLKKAHDTLMAKKSKILQKQEKERKKRIAIKEAEERVKKENQKKNYTKNMRAFLGMVLKQDDLELRFLNSIEEFKTESNFFHHCLFVQDYYAKEDSLIFTCLKKGEKKATVELSLKDFKVLQARGKHNVEDTQLKAQIIKLIEEQNMALKRAKVKHEKKTKQISQAA